MVDLTFDKTDLERLVVDDWQLVCGRWEQVGVIGQWLTIKGDGLELSDGVKNNPLWKHSDGDRVLPLPKFTLAQFKAFCDWHPTFEWEAITSVFTNDDGTLDEVALAELDSRGRAAGALVRGVLVGPDDEYLKAWEADCRVDECKTEIAALKKLKPVSITERMFAKQELETLEARLAELLKPTTDPASPVAEPAPQAVRVTDPVEHVAAQVLHPEPVTSTAEPDVQISPQAAPVGYPEANVAWAHAVPVVAVSIATVPAQHHEANHRRTRRDALKPTIEKAVKACDGRTDAAEVFNKLREWALEKPPRHQPLLGVTPDGIHWLDSNDKGKELSRDALAKRLKPRR